MAQKSKRIFAGLPATRSERLQWLAGNTAKPMFYLAITFLVCVASLVVFWVDVPNLHEKSFSAATVDVSEIVPVGRHRVEMILVGVLLIIWPVVILEAVLHWCTRPWDGSHRKYHWFGLLCCLCPALRMCARLPEMGGRLWLPGLGWRRPNRRLQRKLERIFSMPMIIIALMIMPILVIEFFMKAQVAQYAWLRFLLHVGTGVIWFAFAAEFILMFSVADKKLAYCKKHWVDLAIILLPLFSFLRSLRAMRISGAARLIQIPQMGKMARVYRLRGTAIKAVQALFLLEFFQRWLHRNPEKSIVKLERQLAEMEEESRQLRRKISRLRRQTNEPTESEAAAVAAEHQPS